MMLENNCRILFHGSTAHGVQSLDPRRACEPLAYYARSGPIGQVFRAFQGNPVENDVAVIGLGAGVMACYHQPQQHFTFYEIDPTVLHIAQDRRYFTYLPIAGPRFTSYWVMPGCLCAAPANILRHDGARRL